VCHTTQVVTLGERKTFRVITSDPNPSDVVTLNVVGLPVGATMTPQLPAQGNPASSTFSWIPTQSQGGALVVNFTATSSANGFATCPVTLVATPCGDGTVDGDGFDDIAGTNDDEQCDDGNTVNNDCCSSTCKFETGSCSDGDACTQSDVCDGQGNCAGSNPVVCDAAPGECRDAGSCDPQTGQCVSAARPDGTPCDSGDNCKGDTCQAGECTGLLGCPVEAVNEQGKKIAVLCRGRAGAFCEAQGSLAQLPTLAGSGTVAASVAIGAAVKCPEIVGNASVGTPVTKRVRRKIKGDGAVTLKLKLNKVGKRLLGCAARVDQGLSVNVNTAVKPSKKGPADQLVDFLVLVITK